MLSGFPDRPLSYSELEMLNHSDAIGFVFPATHHSIHEQKDGPTRVCDLLITTGETVTAVVYDEDEGWIMVSKTSPDSPREAAVNDVIEYRDYEIEDEEELLEFVTELYAAMGEFSEKA